MGFIRLKKVYADSTIDQEEYDFLIKEVEKRNSKLKKGEKKWTVKSLLGVWLWRSIDSEIREAKNK